MSRTVIEWVFGCPLRNNIARRSQVSNPKTTHPLAPKFVNWSLMFLVITYEVTSQPKRPGRRVRDRPPVRARDPCRASTSACNTPTPTPVTAPMSSDVSSLIP